MGVANDPPHIRPLSVFYPSVGTYTVYLEYEGRGFGMSGVHTYVCERNERTAYILDRKTKPRMGQIITAYGSKFQVWYIEEKPDGRCNARLEPYHKPNSEGTHYGR